MRGIVGKKASGLVDAQHICHAPNVKCMRQQPHAHFSDAPTMMHMGTNQKAQQSYGSGTDME